MKKEKIEVFGGQDETKDQEVLQELERLPDVEVVYIYQGTKVLDGHEIMPFLFTEEGARYSGVESIMEFVRNKCHEARRGGVNMVH